MPWNFTVCDLFQELLTAAAWKREQERVGRFCEVIHCSSRFCVLESVRRLYTEF